MSRGVRIAIRVAAIAAVVAGLWWFIHGMDVAQLGHALATARLELLIPAALVNVLFLTGGKALGWKLLLAPRHVIALPRLLRYELAAVAASAITPARAGEVLRVWLLKRRDGVPAPTTAAIIVVHKLIDGLAMLLVMAPLPWLLPGLPPWVARTLGIGALVLIAVFAALYVLAGRLDPAAPETAFRRFLAGMRLVRSPRRIAGTLGAMVIAWLADLTAVTLVLRAVGIDLPIAGGLFALFTLNLALVVPSTPGQVGALELGALVALELLGVPHEQGLAFALLYHFGQIVLVLALGLILEGRLLLGGADQRGRENAASPSAPS